MINKIINEDCSKIIPSIENNTIDLVITSPPYNVGDERKGNLYDKHDDSMEYNKYLSWLCGIFELLYDKIAIGGRLCINIGDRKNGKITQVSDIIQRLKNFGYLPYGNIIWNKKHTNHRCAWGSWLSPVSPSFPMMHEHILIFSKESLSLKTRGITDLTKEEFVQYAQSIWEFAPEKRQKEFGHKAMFPEELPLRLIKMLSYPNSLVLDPFTGVGTTAVVAKKLNRKFIGIEISEEYCKIAEKRLKEII